MFRDKIRFVCEGDEYETRNRESWRLVRERERETSISVKKV